MSRRSLLSGPLLIGIARRALPLPVDERAAAAVADRKRLAGELAAKGPGAFTGPDLPERRLPDVPDEVDGEIAAEADFAIRLDLGEIPGDRAEAVPEGVGKISEVVGDLLRRHIGHEGGPGTSDGGVDPPTALETFQEPDELDHLLGSPGQGGAAVERESLPRV